MSEHEETTQNRGITRRQALVAGAVAGAGLLVPFPKGKIRTVMAQGTSPKLDPYVQPVYVPPVLKPLKSTKASDTYEVTVSPNEKWVAHPSLPPTKIWGYNAAWPGPTIVAHRGRKVFFNVRNMLVGEYYLPVDNTLFGATEIVNKNPSIAVHRHGGEHESQYDGGPEDRFGPGGEYLYEYPNDQEAGTLWYHDHSMGVTRLNVYAGMAAFYLLRDDNEMKLINSGKLPGGVDSFGTPFELGFAIQDRIFNADGSLYYTPVWVPEFFGDTFCVNGKVMPYLNVDRGWYRFRIINGCSARFLNIQLNPPPGPKQMYQIGTDVGFLPNPVELPVAPVVKHYEKESPGILFSPGERVDILINFGAYSPDTNVELITSPDVPIAYPSGGTDGLSKIMQFRVKGPKVSQPNIKPESLTLRDKPLTFKDPVVAANAPGIKQRFITLVGPVTGKALINGMEFIDPITEFPKTGTTEVWNFINLDANAHPMHTHLANFQIVDRRPFDVAAYQAKYGVKGPVENPTIPWKGEAYLPAPNEKGPKDTVIAHAGEVTRVIMKWPTKFSGKYVYHCHMLDHEDHEMMRPFIVS